MGYELVRVVGCEQAQTKSGIPKTYAVVERVDQVRVALPDYLVPQYQALRGRYVMMPMVRDTYDKPGGAKGVYWRLDGRGVPIPMHRGPASAGDDESGETTN